MPAMTTDPQPRRYTVEEYFRLEFDATEKHDYRAGEILAMSGGSASHSLIIANTIAALGNRLRGGPCRVYDSNLRIAVARDVRYSYPDASVICGQPEFDPKDRNQTTATNPRLIVEVLSPSTEAADRGEKFERYLKLASLEEYVLVLQDHPRAESFFRRPDGTWLFTYAEGLEALVTLRSLKIDVPLADVYAGVDFNPSLEQNPS
jgi:Uma2 family endonuclease